MGTDLAFAPEREEDELRAYLRDDYRRSDLENYQALLDAEVTEVADEGELYRTSRAYLYNLTAFAMSGTKLPYLRALADHLRPGARVLDYGCGIGSDGLLLLEAGFDVEFADFNNPSTEYLRWRLGHRGFDARVHDLDGQVPGGYDAAFAFDVIEHVPDAFGFIEEMESRAELVEFNLLEFDAHEQELHYRLPINRILARAARRDLVEYRVHYSTSHLVLYRTRKVGWGRSALNLGDVAATRAVQGGRKLRSALRR